MAHVAAVRLTYNPKILWFAHNGVEFRKGDNLIVKTERGLEFGRAEEDLKEVTQDQISNLKSPLKPVIRVATPEDEVAWKNLQQQAADALPVFKQMVAEQGLDMHPVTVEYLFDGDKAVFYFESEDRVDFRELVRALAARFHVRIDMRQIGVRDEARIVGGLGHCGQELCCKRLGGEFNPVSIRMAKDQDLSLNPQKISGVCGRLMCCLRYESDIYKEFKTCSPKMNSMIATPKGDAKVIEVNVPRETVTLLTSDDKRVKVPLAEMEVDKKTGKPCRVPADVFDECMNAVMAGASPVESLVTPIFTGTDAVASNPQARRAKPAAEDQQESVASAPGAPMKRASPQAEPSKRNPRRPNPPIRAARSARMPLRPSPHAGAGRLRFPARRRPLRMQRADPSREPMRLPANPSRRNPPNPSPSSARDRGSSRDVPRARPHNSPRPHSVATPPSVPVSALRAFRPKAPLSARAVRSPDLRTLRRPMQSIGSPGAAAIRPRAENPRNRLWR